MSKKYPEPFETRQIIAQKNMANSVPKSEELEKIFEYTTRTSHHKHCIENKPRIPKFARNCQINELELKNLKKYLDENGIKLLVDKSYRTLVGGSNILCKTRKKRKN